MPKPRLRRSAARREQRRLRIMAMAPDSLNYQEIAETNGLTRRYFAAPRARPRKPLKKHETAVDSFRLAPPNTAIPTLPRLKITP
jgi:hypothetical protein